MSQVNDILVDGKRLKYLKKTRNLNQNDLAKFAGVTEKSIRAWENNKPAHSINLANLARELKIETSELTLDLEEKQLLLANVWDSCETHKTNKPYLLELQLEQTFDLLLKPKDTPIELCSNRTLTPVLPKDETVLLHGPAGIGRTTLLQQLMKSMVENAIQNSTWPMPVLLSLTSWSPDQHVHFETWLIDQLTEQYGLSAHSTQGLLKYNELIILLDDLEKLSGEQRCLCITAINALLKKRRKKHASVSTAVIIACETEKIKETGLYLYLDHSLLIQYPQPQEINHFCQSVDKNFQAFLNSFIVDQQTEITPQVLTKGYQQFLSNKKSSDAQQNIEQEVNALLDNDHFLARYAREDTVRWLAWLATELQRTNNPVFILDRMQPECLSPELSKIVTLLPMLVSGLISGGACGLSVQVALQNDNALMTGLLFGLIGTAVFWLIGIGDKIEPVECFSWSWSALKQDFAQRLAGTLLLLPICGYFGSLVGDVKLGTLIGLFVGTGFFLFYQVPGRTLKKLPKNGQGIINGLKSSLLTTLFSVVFIGTVTRFFYPLHIALPVACGLASMMGLLSGGHVCLQHYALRAMLYRKGYAPWKYGLFLNCAEKFSFLLKTNSGYKFKNAAIQNYFAKLNPP